MIARTGIPVLFIDADPQASLTAFLGVSPNENRPTLLEVITHSAAKIPLYSAIHPVPEEKNIFLIPATDQLEGANHFLAASAMSLHVLRKRIYQEGENVNSEDAVSKNFGIIIVDPPPERSHLALTSLGTGNAWVIPSEANVKGVQSLIRTIELVKTFSSVLNSSQLLGVLPFRARWVGLNPTKTTKESIEIMKKFAGEELMLPHILESDIYKRAINEQMLPRDFGKLDLETPLKAILTRFITLLSPDVREVVQKETFLTPVEPIQDKKEEFLLA
jgi:chromosome partitioning protein